MAIGHSPHDHSAHSSYKITKTLLSLKFDAV